LSDTKKLGQVSLDVREKQALFRGYEGMVPEGTW